MGQVAFGSFKTFSCIVNVVSMESPLREVPLLLCPEYGEPTKRVSTALCPEYGEPTERGSTAYACSMNGTNIPNYSFSEEITRYANQPREPCLVLTWLAMACRKGHTYLLGSSRHRRGERGELRQVLGQCC